MEIFLEAFKNYTKKPNLNMFTPHTHNNYEIFCFLSGDAKYFVEGNIYNLKPGDILIIKKSEGRTPFQPDNVRMFREIGIFSIAVPVVGLIMSIIARIVIGVEVAEISNSFEGFVIGIVVLCITQFFAHGIELEKDVDGLL